MSPPFQGTRCLHLLCAACLILIKASTAAPLEVARTYYIQAELVWWSNFCGELGSPQVNATRPDCLSTRDNDRYTTARGRRSLQQYTPTWFNPDDRNYVNRCRDPFHQDALLFSDIYSGGYVEQVIGGVQVANQFIGGVGSIFIKAVYREYTDATFTKRLDHNVDDDAYLGTLGPLLHAVEGEYVEVIFRNTIEITRKTGWNETVEGPYFDVVDPSTNPPTVVFPAANFNDTDLIREHAPGMFDIPTWELKESLTLYPQTGISVIEGTRAVHYAMTGVSATYDFTPLAKEIPPSRYDPTVAASSTSVGRFLWFAARTANPSAQAYYYRANPLMYHVTQNAGLYGMIAVEKNDTFKGWNLDSRGMPLAPKGIDKEVVIVIHVQLEDASFCADLNCYTVTPFRYGSNDTKYNRNRAMTPAEQLYPSDPATGGSYAPHCNTILDPEPFTHHVINGLFYCNLPDIDLYRGQNVRWFVSVIGDQGDTHPLHFHGNTLVDAYGKRVDNVVLAPGAVQTLDMFIDNAPGNWLAHCHISDHIGAGMVFWYNVLPNASKPYETYYPPMGQYTAQERTDAANNMKPLPIEGGTRKGDVREYWIKTHAVLVNYSSPTPHNLDYSSVFANGTYNWEYDQRMNDKYGYTYPVKKKGDPYDPYHGTCKVNAQPCKLRLPGEVGPNGCTFWKEIYVEYMLPDGCKGWSCALPKPRHVDEFHRGLLGPVLKAEVGDVIRVHFMNDPFPQCIPATANPLCKTSDGQLDPAFADSCNLSCNLQFGDYTSFNQTVVDQNDLVAGPCSPSCSTDGTNCIPCGNQAIVSSASEISELAFSMHPHGVWYTKNNEGAPYYDMTSNTYAYASPTDMGGPKLLKAPQTTANPGIVGEEVWQSLSLLGPEEFGDLSAYFPKYNDKYQLGPGSVYPRQHDDFVPSAFMCVQDVISTSYYKFFTTDGTPIRELCAHTVSANIPAAVDITTISGMPTKETYDCVRAAGCDQFTYEWFVEERTGPAPGEGECTVWAGHSHADEVTDVYAGLAFMILACLKGSLKVDTYKSPGPRAGQSPFLEELYNHNLTVSRLAVKNKIADKEIYMLWHDVQEQGSALCALNGFLNLPSGAKQCDNAFLVDYPTVNGLTFCLPELQVKADERAIMGFFGMGSEPDYNSVGFNGLPLEHMNHKLQIENFVLLPGVTSLMRFNASLVPLNADGVANVVMLSGASDFANRGQQATVQIVKPKNGYVSPYVQTPTAAAQDWVNTPSAVSSKFYKLQARLKKHDFWQDIARDPVSGAPLTCDNVPVDEGIVGDNTEGPTTIGTVHYMAWYTNAFEVDNATNVLKPDLPPLPQYGIVGPILTAYANHSINVNLCNINVPFPVTLLMGCGIQVTRTPPNPYLNMNQCGDYTFFIPSWLDPWTALSGSQKTSLPCMYYSMPNASASLANTKLPNTLDWNGTSAPGYGQHTTGGLAGLVVVKTSHNLVADATKASEYVRAIDLQRDMDAIDIPLMFKVHDMNRVHPELQKRTKAAHGGVNPLDPLFGGFPPFNGKRPLTGNITASGLGLLKWTSKVGSTRTSPPADPYQYIFEATPNMYWKNVDCQTQSADSDCHLADCAPSDSCPICNYDTNFEMRDGCDPFQYNYQHYKFAINGYSYCSGGNWLPKIHVGKVYRLHLFAPPGDYYFYFQDLQMHDVYNVQFRGLQLPTTLYKENVTLLSSVVDNRNTVIWPMQAHEIDIYFPETLQSYDGRIIIFDENQLNTEKGMTAALDVRLRPTQCWLGNPLDPTFQQYTCPVGWVNKAYNATQTCTSTVQGVPNSCAKEDCCEPRQYCAYTTKGAPTVRRGLQAAAAKPIKAKPLYCPASTLPMPLTTLCAGSQCQESECCQPVCPANKGKLCGPDYAPRFSGEGTVPCPGSSCVTNDCCLPKCSTKACSYDSAGVLWVNKPGKNSIACTGPTCTDSECCDQVCSPTFTCPDPSIPLTSSKIVLCPSTPQSCTSDICCMVPTVTSSACSKVNCAAAGLVNRPKQPAKCTIEKAPGQAKTTIDCTKGDCCVQKCTAAVQATLCTGVSAMPGSGVALLDTTKTGKLCSGPACTATECCAGACSTCNTKGVCASAYTCPNGNRPRTTRPAASNPTSSAIGKFPPQQSTCCLP